MNKINWKTRLLNKSFWLTITPQVIATIFIIYGCIDDLVSGIVYGESDWVEFFTKLIIAIFLILGTIGVVNDPNSVGFKDTARAQSYEKPWDDKVDKDEPKVTVKEE